MRARLEATRRLLVASCKGTCADVLQALANGANVNGTTRNGSTALHFAVGQSKVELVTALLAAGGCANSARSDGTAPLHMACHTGARSVVSVLLSAGALINQSKRDGTTPLQAASRAGRHMVVADLLAAGAVLSSDEALSHVRGAVGVKLVGQLYMALERPVRACGRWQAYKIGCSTAIDRRFVNVSHTFSSFHHVAVSAVVDDMRTAESFLHTCLRNRRVSAAMLRRPRNGPHSPCIVRSVRRSLASATRGSGSGWMTPRPTM